MWLTAKWLVSTLWNNGIVDSSLFIHSQGCFLFLIFLIIAFGLYVGANKHSSGLAPRGSPLGRIWEDRNFYCYHPMTKEVLTNYGNTVWPSYVLGPEERQPVHGSPSECAIN